ncbi:unnamed protein product [Ectocarpus sp. 8 AP-2014]
MGCLVWLLFCSSKPPRLPLRGISIIGVCFVFGVYSSCGEWVDQFRCYQFRCFSVGIAACPHSSRGCISRKMYVKAFSGRTPVPRVYLIVFSESSVIWQGIMDMGG